MESRQLPRRIILISCLFILAILGALLFQGVEGEKSENQTALQKGSSNEGYLSLLQLQDEMLRAKEHQLAELEEQLKFSDSGTLATQKAEELKQASLEIATLKKEIHELQAALDKQDQQEQIDQLVDRLETKKAELASADASLSSMQQEIAKSREEFQKKEEAISTLEMNYLIQVNALTEEKNALAKTLQENSEKMTRLESGFHESKRPKLIAQIETLKKERTEQEKRLATITKELTEGNSALLREKNSLATAVEENRNTIAQLQQKLAEQEAALQQTLVTEEQKAKILTEQIAQLKTQNNEQEKRLSQLSDTAKLLPEKIQTLTTLEKQFQEERNKRQIKEQLLQQMQGHLDQQKNALEKMEGTRLSLAKELEITKKSYAQLMDEVTKRTPTPGVRTEVVLEESQKHAVQPGETLMSISQKYYGTTKKWTQIYEANKSVIADKNKIKPGTELYIPAH